jgi:hypothetical protein
MRKPRILWCLTISIGFARPSATVASSIPLVDRPAISALVDRHFLPIPMSCDNRRVGFYAASLPSRDQTFARGA